MPWSNPYGPHINDLTPEAKETALAQSDGRLLKTLVLDRSFLEQYRERNRRALIIYRPYFGDDSLDNVAGRCAGVIQALNGYEGLVDVVEAPWNESHQGVFSGIRAYGKATIEANDRFKMALPWIKVAGGNWSVGNPPGLWQDWTAWAGTGVLAYIDYHSFHEYDFPRLHHGVVDKGGGALEGYKVLRHRLVYAWLEKQGLPTPPIILSEFGIDGGGGGKGWRTYGQGIDAYMADLSEAAAWLNGYKYVVGATPFCCGVNDKANWGSFDLAGAPEFKRLLQKEFPPGALYGSYSIGNGSVVGAPTHASKRKVSPVSEFKGWIQDPRNQHDHNNKPSFLRAFLTHQEDNASVSHGTFTWERAVAGGYPRDLLPADLSAFGGEVDKPGKPAPVVVESSKTLPTDTRAQVMAAKAAELDIPLYRMQAILRVESNGQPFDNDRAVIRLELAQLWDRLAVGSERSEFLRIFRFVDGAPPWHNDSQEYLDGEGNWVKLQQGGQDLRWQALIAAEGFCGDKAFQATSMGVAQVMGFHHRALGIRSAKQMLESLDLLEINQLNAFQDLIAGSKAMWGALKGGDAGEFARLYNGPGAWQRYQTLLMSAGWDHFVAG